MNQIQMLESRIRVTSGKKVLNIIRLLVNARGVQLESSRVLHEALLVSVLM